MSVLVGGLLLTAGPVAAADLVVPLKSIAQLTVDDDGLGLSYPAAVFFDAVEEEIYVSNGGRSRVVVYGPDFFPRMSIGNGRGVAAPRGGLVMSNGEVYICQVRNRKNPRARITILNAAFFVDREIFLDEIPEAAGFIPSQLAINRDGIIYLAGASSRGVLVLDNEGNFLRRLEPQDQISSMAPVEEAGEEEKQPEEEDSFLANIPEEFRPKTSKLNGGGNRLRVGLGPVKINHVTIDSTGRLYLLSLETSKVYVYGPDETFLFSFGQKGGTPRHMSQPKSLVIDENRGLIYIVDYMRHSILVYDMTGQYIFEFGGRGFGPGWFNYPISLALNKQGQIIVADLFNQRVQVLEIGFEELYQVLGIAPPKGTAPAESEAGEAERDELEGGEEEKEPETGKPAEQDKMGAGEGEKAPETGKPEQDELAPRQSEETSTKEKEPAESGEAVEQDEPAPGQIEDSSDQEKASSPPLEQAEPAGRLEEENPANPE